MKYGIFPLPQTAKIWTYSAFALSVFSVGITDLWTFYEVFPSNKLLGEYIHSISHIKSPNSDNKCDSHGLA